MENYKLVIFGRNGDKLNTFEGQFACERYASLMTSHYLSHDVGKMKVKFDEHIEDGKSIYQVTFTFLNGFKYQFTFPRS